MIQWFVTNLFFFFLSPILFLLSLLLFSCSLPLPSAVCSEVTASLLRTRLRVHPKFVQPLPLNSPVVLDNTKITLLDANHCPGKNKRDEKKEGVRTVENGEARKGVRGYTERDKN